MSEHYLCVHTHFYQPPRGRVAFADDDPGEEPEAKPYRNFNEKAAAECYTPNAALGNFSRLSFNLGSMLAQWLEHNAPDTYQQIIAADQTNVEKWGVGNALAQPAHHAILPLSQTSDDILQVRWGLISFEHRFGHPAEGMWLPEMAVDLETLQVLHDNGVKFTILSQAQVRDATDGAGPYWVKLPSQDRIAVYVRDDYQSVQVAFGVKTLGGAGRWARSTLSPLKKHYGRLFLLALDGETFGYYQAGEEHFLHWLLTYEAEASGYEVTTLARDLRDHPPTKEIEINEYTSWNCPHGLARWSTGCECTPGDARWKGALRRALDNLANRLDEAYYSYARRLTVEPDLLREAYFRVYLGQMTEGQFLRDYQLTRLTSPESGALLTLLLAQFYRQRMYVSSTFFGEDLDKPEPRYGVANAVRAALLTAQATDTDFIVAFRHDLAQAVSNQNGKTGAQILDEILAQARESSAA
jgi:alpha-amylase/alpha-mannosidase (GH57 family)